MALHLSMNIGFVTNSSSMVYHIPRALIEHPSVQAFMKAYEIEDGFIGIDLWHRGYCATVAITREQKLEVRKKLHDSDYGTPPPIATDNEEEIVIVIGDEHETIAKRLVGLLERLNPAEDGRTYNVFGGYEFNLDVRVVVYFVVNTQVRTTPLVSDVYEKGGVVSIVNFPVAGGAEKDRLVQLLLDGFPARHARGDRELLVG